MAKFKKTIAAALSAVMLLSASSQLLSVTADASTTEKYVISARSYAVGGLQATYGGERVDGENLLTDVELTGSEARSLSRKPGVLTVEKDIELTGDTAEETNEATRQWNLDAIGVTAGGEQTQPARRVKIAIIDSGISYTGDIFAEESINLTDDGNENPLFNDASGHGTAVAGIICAADDDIGITGINPNAAIYSAKVLDSENKSPLSRILQGIYWAIENEVDIINMSFGTDVDSEILHNAVRDAYEAGILLIASSGNTAGGNVKYPAAYSEVIAVGATDPSGEIWANTSVGAELELLAPGEKILTSGFLGGTLGTSGTSVAAAQVTGVASLLMQRDASKSADFIRALLSASAKRVGDFGLIDYAYASEIYNDFADRYEEPDTQTESFANETEPTDYSDSAESVVEGMWWNNASSGSHGNISDGASSGAGLSASYANTIKFACTNVDNYRLSDKKVSAFHGRGNYAANIRFLSNFAQEIRGGVNVETAISNAAAKFTNIITSSTVNGKKVYSSNTNSSNNYKYFGLGAFNDSDGDIMVQMITAIRDIYANLTNTGRDAKIRLYEEAEIGPKRRFLVFEGIIMHMIGDVYAHRSIVPEYAVYNVTNDPKNPNYASRVYRSSFVTETSPTESYDEVKIKKFLNVETPFFYNQRINDINKYRSWGYFKKAVAAEIVEFQSVVLFEKYGAKDGNNYMVDYRIYDDDPNICRERYNDALRCCKMYLKDVINKNFEQYDSILKFKVKYLFPEDDYVKLNNFKQYCIAAGHDTGVESDFYGQWKYHSVFNIPV